MPEIAYVNGTFLPLERATVHVEDRGYQFADAVYEVVRTYHGQPFALDEHLERLDRSLDAVRISLPDLRLRLPALIREGIRQAAFPEALVYLQISRGQARRHRGIPSHAAPVLVITVRELPNSRQIREQGITAITVPDIRWGRCDIKSVGLLANVLAYEAAHDAGANDALFVEADGTVNEATAGNVFLVKNDRLTTPAKGPKILTGVTRGKIMEAGRSAGLTVEERRVTKDELLAADEVFLTSTTAEAVPVTAIDRRAIGSGKPGPVAAQVYAQFMRKYVQP
jgi:D-alanine transaminase